MTEYAPTPGRIVLYQLSEDDATYINRRRNDAVKHIDYHRENSDGVQIHWGNDAYPNDVYPAVVVRVVSQNYLNLKVFLDGNDDLWVTSRAEGSEPGEWAWPTRL